MTTETRITTIEAQLQQLTINITTLASITTQQSFEWNQRFNHLAELVASNSKAIEGLTRAIESMNERMDRLEQRVEQLDQSVNELDQKLEERTDTILQAIDRGIDRAIAETVAPLQNQITGLQTEMQRVIERLGEIQS